MFKFHIRFQESWSSQFVLTIYIAFVSLTMFSCKEHQVNNPTSDKFTWHDGFEASENDLNLLFPANEERWTNMQIVNPTHGENSITLVDHPVHSGGKALKIVARSSDNVLSKADIEKGDFRIFEGGKVEIEAYFYIEGDQNIRDLLLIDLESCDCWDPTVEGNTCPGIRLIMSGENDFLSIERGKILGNTISQTQTSFPRNQWVKVNWKLNLSTENGFNQLFINDQMVIESDGFNMPNAEAFRDEAAQYDIDFNLVTPVYYHRIQIGATANPGDQDITLFLDDVSITYKNP